VANADLARTSALMKEENERMLVDLKETWGRNFHRMFEGVQPAKPGGGRGFEQTWDEGVKKHYEVTAGQCGMGDDVHDMDVSAVLI
jgi:hypothetical protein